MFVACARLINKTSLSVPIVVSATRDNSEIERILPTGKKLPSIVVYGSSNCSRISRCTRFESGSSARAGWICATHKSTLLLYDIPILQFNTFCIEVRHTLVGGWTTCFGIHFDLNILVWFRDPLALITPLRRVPTTRRDEIDGPET
jgi:hypothetical protein